MVCPKCYGEIEISKEMTRCLLCGSDIELNVKNQLAAEDFVNNVLSDSERKQIEELLIDDKRSDALHLIHNIRGKKDTFVDVRIRKIIEQTSENELLKQHLRNIEIEREWKKKHPQLTHCTACGKDISIRAQSCPNCGNPTGVHVCPKCNGINTKVITGASKATSIFLWGAFAANKVVSKYQCKDCGHKF